MEENTVTSIRQDSYVEEGGHLQTLSTTSASGKRVRGRSFRLIMDAFVESMKAITPKAFRRGRSRDWLGHAVDSEQ